MAIETAPGALSPVIAIALVGGLGVGSQWLAWRLRMPAIVLMLAAGIVIGPVLGVFDPARDIGPLMTPIIAIAVAVILFEGGLTLNFHKLRDAAVGVRRLVFVGAPVGWILSALVLRYGAGLSWSSSWVFGGIMIVTGPTVIAPLLRTARLARRPAQLLQWEAIVNDPIGAIAAVLAFQVVLVLNSAETVASAVWVLALGIGCAIALGLAGGYGLAWAFRNAHVPEYMKVSILFAALLGIFGLSDAILHESGLLAVTVMGIVIANANLASYAELRRFKEHATILLVSGVFILLAASLDFAELGQLTGRAALFVALIILVARPVTVFLSLAGSGLPWREQVLVAFTGPRGVVLVAVAGLFADRLVELGLEDARVIGPLAFVLVAATVVIHGFTLKPMARFLKLAGAGNPGVIIVGGSEWTTALAEALAKADVPVLMTDANFGHLRKARTAGIATFTGDILSEAAEQRLELVSYDKLLAATDNDAYNTLVATDLGPEFGRENVFQIERTRTDGARHTLPATLGGRPFGHGVTFDEWERLVKAGWTFRITRLTEEFTLAHWQEKRPRSHLVGRILPNGDFRLLHEDEEIRGIPDTRLIALRPPDPKTGSVQPPADT
ncbi:sodium:proton antiporter [Salipiger sp. IMCC34102]|uniref:cation:proton antiporter n=1 Tax=Salipiger sp. IMCC34102 TaxID=2510647 RepID=UPI00101BE155|nr:sodium:proton antiporter [Salipiger sp. IMCC34102]RYH03241.1 sodium:proton antiporter [Salipiger sp. IMCC34102]